MRFTAVVVAALSFHAVVTGQGFGNMRSADRMRSAILAERPDQNELIHVIVRYRRMPNDNDARAAMGSGGRVRQLLPGIRAGAYALKPSDIVRLAEQSDVEDIFPDHEVSATMQYARPAVGTSTAWSSGYTGKGVGIAVVDSGVVLHPDMSNRVVYSESFVGYSGTRDWNDLDTYGHGTSVIGIAAGSGSVSAAGGKGVSYAGIAPGANVISLRVLDANGKGRDSDVIAAIERAIALKSKYNIRVLNLSLGRPVYQSYAKDPLCQAVEKAWKAGIVVVVAAGNLGRDNSFKNSGYGTITAPGNHPYVITVGAMRDLGTSTRTDDLIASYSSKGPTLIDRVVKPDIVAPGNRIVSTNAYNTSLATKYSGNWVPQSNYVNYGSSSGTSDYYQLSGTSMAAPIVSGAAAILIQKDPSLTPDDVKARLMKTAYKTFPLYSTAMDPSTSATYTSQHDMLTIGAGYLDIEAALRSTDRAKGPGSASSPVVTRDANGSVVLTLASNTIWAKSVVWGTSVVWGSNVFVTGSSSVLWAGSVVWGTSVVWGSTSPYASSVVWGAADTISGQNVLINGDK